MKTHENVSIGVIGCSNISFIYLQAPGAFKNLTCVACADQVRERAESQAATSGVPKVLSVEELLADPEIEIVLNLTVPQAHAEIGMAALLAGKSVYTEKPLALDCQQGQEMLILTAERGLLVGNAPDTFLGGGFQTCIDLINDGTISTPLAATAFMMGHGPESWQYALRTGKAHRANGDLAFHVLDIMQRLHESAHIHHRITLGSTCSRPASLDPEVFVPGVLR